MKGKVKWYREEKGYGFITGEDGKDYFVHNSAIVDGKILSEGDSVTFETAKTDKGVQAKDVKLE